ncbi:MAG: SPOR domain-containing protein [Methyloceanibacter sp.]
MADHRKTFRPRHLLLGASLLLVGSVLPALAEDAGLKNGAAALSAGKYDNAVRMLSSTINSDNASPSDAARALYLRGIAYRKLGQPARALSDLGAAIFLGLPDEDRVKALVNRGLAYQAAGLSSQGDAEIAQARRVGGSGAVDQLIAEGGGTPASAASVAAFSTSVTPDAQGSAAPETPTRTAGSSGQWTTTADAETGRASASSGNRVSRWFGSLTGSSSSPPAPPPVSAPTESSAAATPVPAKPPAAPSTGWSAQTQASQTAVASGPRPAPPSTGWGAQTQGGDTVVASDATPSQSRWSRWFSKTAEADQPPPPPAPATGGRGGFQLQLATSRSEGDAQALWKQVSSANTGLSGKSPDIEKVDIGNFGTFYSLKVGPFPDKAESLKVCNALKRNGVDCSVVSPEAQ